MAEKPLKFRHETIDPDPPGSMHDITLVGDINGDGRNEIIIGGKKGPPNLFWYEFGTWTRHDMADAPELEAGGVLLDVNGNGRLDVVAGQQINGRKLFWFENPPDPTRPWPVHVITDRFDKYHDQAVGDVDGDGEAELVFLSQKAGVLAYYKVPADPTVTPWPEDCLHVIDDAVPFETEGLWIGDIDGDGAIELLAGTSVYRRGADGNWKGEPFLVGYRMTRPAVADLTGEGTLDIVVAEGESDPAKLAIVWGGVHGREVQILRDDLFHPHSLAVADFDSDGRPDVFVGEMGLGGKKDSKILIYRNLGGGKFEETLISEGVPIHEGKVADVDGDGRPDIVGKPYDPQRHIDVWFNET